VRIITLSVLPVLLALEVAVAVERWGHEILALLRGASRSRADRGPEPAAT
jgi:hypothetical protein